MTNSVTNRNSGNLAELGVGPRSFENRNEFLPDADKMRQELLDVLQYYCDNQDVDASPLEIGQVNSQKEVMRKVAEAVGMEEYPTAQAILFREDLKMTPQMEEIALRLNRLVQVDVRQGTTDSMEFPQAKSVIRQNVDELARHYNDNDQSEAKLILANVSEAATGTREMGLDELQKTREMVQKVLKDLFVGDYAAGLAPHRLEGQEQGMKFINRDRNPKLAEYLRLFDALTLEIMRQREIAQDQEKRLTLERDLTMNLLGDLAQQPGIDFNDRLKELFSRKVAIMDLNQLMYFNHKIRELSREYSGSPERKIQANKVIKNWLKKDFTAQEMHRELAQMKNKNQEEKARQLEILRGHLRGQVITMPVREPVRPENLKRAA